MSTPSEALIAQLEALIDKVTPGPRKVEVEAEPEGEQPEVYLCSEQTFCDFTVVATMGRADSIPQERKLADAEWMRLTQPANIRTLLDALSARSREVERLTADSARLEWLMSRGARVVWHGKDSEFCSVWLPGTWDGDPERQVTGLHVEAREAIDEARRARQALEAPHE